MLGCGPTMTLPAPPHLAPPSRRGIIRATCRSRSPRDPRGCYLRRRSGSPPVGTKRSASRESSHSERNALAASPRRRGRLQRSPCLAGTRAALLGLRVVSCLSSSIDRRYGRKYGRCGGHAGVFPERAPKRLPRSLSLKWLRALQVEWGPREQHPYAYRSSSFRLPKLPRSSSPLPPPKQPTRRVARAFTRLGLAGGAAGLSGSSGPDGARFAPESKSCQLRRGTPGRARRRRFPRSGRRSSLS